MKSKRTAISLIAISLLCIAGLLFFGCAQFGKIHFDYGQRFVITARVLDDLNKKPLANAHVFFEVKEHPYQWPLPGTANFDIGVTDSKGVVDLSHLQGFAETISSYQFNKEHKKGRGSVKFVVTITKEGYADKIFEFDEADLPLGERDFPLVNLGDVYLTPL